MSEDEARDCAYAICTLWGIRCREYVNGCWELFAPRGLKFACNGCVNLPKQNDLIKGREEKTWTQILDCLHEGLMPLT